VIPRKRCRWQVIRDVLRKIEERRSNDSEEVEGEKIEGEVEGKGENGKSEEVSET